jgi:hypothetical protein
MGGVLSSSSTVQTTHVENKDTPVEESKSTDTTQAVATIVEQPTSQTVTSPINDTPSNDVNSDTVSNSDENKQEGVLEKYVEPSGTKVEVAPVEVAPNADVVKKTKKKNKKHHH